jgi:hypothetical protein
MEKILIRFNKKEYDIQMSRLNGAIRRANQMVIEINDVNGYVMTPADVQDALQSQGNRASAGVLKASEADLNRLDIRSKALRESTVKSDQEAYYRVLNKYKDLQEYAHDVAVDDDCKVHLASGVEERVKDEYSHYIQTEKGKAIYEAQQKVVEGMNEILRLSNMFTSLSIGQIATPIYDKREVKLFELRYDNL